MEVVKADWAHELSAYQQNPAAITFALQHLPAEKPPTVLEFKALCRQKPRPEVPVIPFDKASPEVVAKVVSGITKPAKFDPKAWAHALKRREEGGGKLTLAQRHMWREALGDATQ